MKPISANKGILSERASQGEQNGANFSSVAPSSEELLARKDMSSILAKTPYYSPWFSAKN